MNRYEYIRRYRRGRRHRRTGHAALIAGCVALLLLGGTAAFLWGRHRIAGSDTSPGNVVVMNPTSGSDSADIVITPEEPETDSAFSDIPADHPAAGLLKQARLLALGYDYEAALALLQSDANLASDPLVTEAIADYEAAAAALVPVKISEVTHVFFHSLIIDTARAFDGDSDEKGYNQVMTTADEFNKILQSMYDKGYVLVKLHDLAYEATDESGKTVMKPGTILLPEGKIPFVMSQDDVCYYPYMDGDGFASRIIIGEDGKPTCEMKLEDGSVSVGAYDLVPILEAFIEQHPDFSYKGARAVLAFTGYEGILGYRTSSAYADSPTYEADRQEAARVAQCLKDNGWELASHSWGHLNLGSIEMERFTADTDKWETEVDSLIGPTDIILYPFGADVGDWHPYTMENERFRYLYNVGFRYFCNVDSSRHWVQIGDDYMRQGRRNLDGYRMWKDITAEDPSKRRLDDLFRAEDVFDQARPVPVPDM
ncbi:MAG: polysaccharide deacetylase [Lachnospiraceae bacterium]|nr:polysaccharide deacetylase [Lachnospiraceae bacterium]